MSALILDGKALAKKTEDELTQCVDKLKASSGHTPILATILVGDDPASATYVKMKGNACSRIGMESLKVEMPTSTTTEQLLAKINELNANPAVHGILLQHPVPEQIDERACFDAIALEKDVDGVTCLGFGRMAMGEEAYGCATPKGIMRLLEAYNIELNNVDIECRHNSIHVFGWLFYQSRLYLSAHSRLNLKLPSQTPKQSKASNKILVFR